MDRLTAAHHLDRLAQGEAWSDELTTAFIEGAMRGTVERNQVAAFLMAVACRGLSREGLHALTMSYVHSGRVLPRGGRPVVDKHSTGGVGDKLTFLVCPLVAAAGGQVRKMSGKSLRHCAGTIDKLSAVPGFRHEAGVEAFLAEVDHFGFSIVPQSADLCPADALTYDIRDVCGSTGSPDLIAASIMSKKIAAGASGVVLDVKLGPGSLFASDAQGISVGRAMLDIARLVGMRSRVFFTDMSRPLGRTIGGMSEVGEALHVLSGGGDPEVRILAIELAGAMLSMSDGGGDPACLDRVRAVLNNGSAHRLFGDWLAARGAEPGRLEARFGAPPAVPVRANRNGWIAAIAPERLGRLAKTLSPPGTVSGNILLHKGVGDSVEVGEVLALLDDGTEHGLDVGPDHIASALEAFSIADEQGRAPRPRFLAVLGSDQEDREVVL